MSKASTDMLPDHPPITKGERKVIAAVANDPATFVKTEFGRQRAPGPFKRATRSLSAPFRFAAKLLKNDAGKDGVGRNSTSVKGTA